MTYRPTNLPSRARAKAVLERHWQERGEILPFHVSGHSMGTAIPSGAIVHVRFHRNIRLAPGNIVYLRRGHKRVVHRVLWRIGPILLEKGDANRVPRLCLRRHVLGEVIGISSEAKASAIETKPRFTGSHAVTRTFLPLLIAAVLLPSCGQPNTPASAPSASITHSTPIAAHDSSYWNSAYAHDSFRAKLLETMRAQNADAQTAARVLLDQHPETATATQALHFLAADFRWRRDNLSWLVAYAEAHSNSDAGAYAASIALAAQPADVARATAESWRSAHAGSLLALRADEHVLRSELDEGDIPALEMRLQEGLLAYTPELLRAKATHRDWLAAWSSIGLPHHALRLAEAQASQRPWEQRLREAAADLSANSFPFRHLFLADAEGRADMLSQELAALTERPLPGSPIEEAESIASLVDGLCWRVRSWDSLLARGGTFTEHSSALLSHMSHVLLPQRAATDTETAAAFADAALFCGKRLVQAAQYADAEEFLRFAAQQTHDPERSSQATFALCDIYINQWNAYDTAIQSLTALQAIPGYNIESHLLLAQAEFKRHDPDASIAHLDRYLAENASTQREAAQRLREQLLALKGRPANAGEVAHASNGLRP